MTKFTQYYTAHQVRELERLAIQEHHIPGFALMQRAGNASFHALFSQWPAVTQLIIFCGTGNNGGDGFVIAGLAMRAGLKVEVFVFGKLTAISGDALKAFEFAREQNVSIRFVEEPPSLATPSSGTVIVDALLGTGLSGEVRTLFRQAIEAINHSDLPVLAIDIPSGLCSDTGAVLGACVKADLTVTFIGKKIGLVVGSGPAMCGKVIFDDLAVPAAIYGHIKGIDVPEEVGAA